MLIRSPSARDCSTTDGLSLVVVSVLQEILQRSVSVEDQRQGAPSSRAPSKTTLNELLDTLKLLEEEPESLSEPKCYRKEKYAWIDEVRPPHVTVSSERPVPAGYQVLCQKHVVPPCSASSLCFSLKDGDSNSLTTDNLERHGQLSHPALPDGGALLSEAKLQSIMSFLDEMEKSEQERPRSVTSGSHREVGVGALRCFSGPIPTR